MIKNTKIPENWIEVRITNDKLQELENIGNRKILILNILKGIKEELENRNLIKWFFWLFEPDNKFVSNKTVICIMVRCCTQIKENTDIIENIIREKLLKISFKENEEFRIVRDNGVGEINKYGEEGLECFYNFMNDCCRFAFLHFDESNRQYELLNEDKFIHCFINCLGLYYPQEAEKYLQLFIARALIFKNENNKKELKEYLKNMIEENFK